MGALMNGFRAHRRVLAMSAALLLPLSTAAATASVPSTPTAATLNAAPSGLAMGASSGLVGPVPSHDDVRKASPVGWTLVDGHTVVIVGSVGQRVAEVSATTSYDVPVAALDAYRSAASLVATSTPGCHLSWTLLAAIGQVESSHGRYGGAVVLANGDTSPHILGPVLDGGAGVGAISDSDGGRYDGDAVWDRAVGPMQFIPGTWAGYGADGNGDGVRDPNNIADAALAAAGYLCAGGGDLRVESQLRAAVMRYNHSVAYVDLVLSLASAYAHGGTNVVPNGSATTAPIPDDVINENSTGHTDSRKPTGSPAAAPAGPAPREHAAKLPGQHAHKVPGSGRQHDSGGGTGGGGSGGGGSGGGGTGGGGSGGTGGGGGGGGGSQPPPVVSNPAPPVTTSPLPPQPGHHKSGPAQPAPVIGVLLECETGWCVDVTPLDFGADADMTQRLGDVDGDGRTRSLERELRSLEGQTFELTVIEKSVEDSPKAAPTSTETLDTQAPTSTEGTPEDPLPIIITLDADGLVTSINAIPYLP